MRIKITILLLSFLCISCLEAPVKYKQKNFVVSKEIIQEYCHTLENLMEDYSCTKYFKQTYKLKKEEESIQVKLSAESLQLTYTNEADKNGELYELYEEIRESL